MFFFDELGMGIQYWVLLTQYVPGTLVQGVSYIIINQCAWGTDVLIFFLFESVSSLIVTRKQHPNTTILTPPPLPFLLRREGFWKKHLSGLLTEYRVIFVLQDAAICQENNSASSHKYYFSWKMLDVFFSIHFTQLSQELKCSIVTTAESCNM